MWPETSISFYKKNKEGKYERQDLSRIADDSTRRLGREFHKMSADDKKNYLLKLRAKEEFEKIQKQINLE